MKCPSCGYNQADGRTDCEACGLIFAKWRERHEAPKPALSGPREPNGPALPSCLEIHGNLFTGYYWYEFLIRELSWLPILGVGWLLIFLKPTNLYWVLLPLFLIGLHVILYLIMWFPRKLAVLTSQGLQFASPLSWALFIPKWYEAQWSDVTAVREVQRYPFMKFPFIYQVALEVRLPGKDQIKVFGVRSFNKDYLEFLKFVHAKVDKTKIDKRILDFMEPETLKNYQQYRAQGKKYGAIWGLAIALIWLSFRNELFHDKVAGIPLWIFLVIALFILGRIFSKMFLVPPK